MIYLSLNNSCHLLYCLSLFLFIFLILYLFTYFGVQRRRYRCANFGVKLERIVVGGPWNYTPVGGITKQRCIDRSKRSLHNVLLFCICAGYPLSGNLDLASCSTRYILFLQLVYNICVPYYVNV